MIIAISLALLISGTLLVLLNNIEVSEIPIYLGSGVILGVLSSIAISQGIVSHSFIERDIMREITLLGLSILIFYSTSGMLVDTRRKVAINAFKTIIWLSGVSLALITAICYYIGLGILESLLFGITASVGSTLLDADLVKEEARKNHIYSWLAENMNFYDDLFGIVTLSLIFSWVNDINILVGLVASSVIILVGLLLRNIFSDLILKITGGENELVLLSGIATLISMVWVTEELGISALAGIYASGLLLANTELGFNIRERFSAVKDFFTALSFISIGYLISVPNTKYLFVAAVLVIFSTIIRPLIATQVLRLQGYDLKTSFMSSIQSSQISEIIVVGSIILSPFVEGPIFGTVAISFVTTILIAHLIEDRERRLFETLFSDYELDSEKSFIPPGIEGHLILAGYDWKTKELEDIVDGLDVVVADYNLEKIEAADEKGLPHLLADLNSEKAWEKLMYEDAAIIVSAIDNDSLKDRIKELDTEADRILIDSSSDDVRNELQRMVRKSLEKKKK